eukprot:GHVQ01021205.1.p1 GENE.GHVQ01021205.1~~GHVQ01021205.1.p1  ORF type:complete len:269 (-),score=43.06 GHVQ01021205.1:1416-2222(-)
MQSTSTTDRHQLAMEGRSGLLSKSSSHWHQHQRRQQQRHLHLQQRPSSVSRRLMSASAGKFHGTSDTPAEVPSCTTPARATAATAACRGSVSSATRVYQGGLRDKSECDTDDSCRDLAVELSMSVEQVVQAKEVFRVLDHSDCGEIVKDEMGDAIKTLYQGITDEELQEILSEVDADESGTIDENEFLSLIAKIFHDRKLEDELREVFQFIDRMNNGFLSWDDLRAASIQLGDTLSDTLLTGMINEADTDGDGQVSFQDFKKLFASNS